MNPKLVLLLLSAPLLFACASASGGERVAPKLICGRTVAIAHRGGAGPDGTIACARRSLAAGITFLEFDVRRTRDGEAVILHDPTVDRTTDGTGAVAEMTLQEVRKLDAGVKYRDPAEPDTSYAGERVPTARDIIRFVGDRGIVLLELKVADAAGPVVAALQAEQAFHRVVVRSPDKAVLRRLKELDPRVRAGTMGSLPEGDLDAFASELKDLGVVALTVPAVERPQVDKFHAQGIAVWGRNTNDPAVMSKLIEAGVDGIITDACPVLAELLKGQEPVRVLFDSDMDGDCDDVAALALLHVLADRGEAEILATVASSRSAGTPSCLDAINTYYGRGTLPVGVPKAGIQRASKYTEAVAKACPHDLKSVDEAEDALEVYRRVLGAQPDGSAVVVTVGFHTNVAALLRSPGGEDLVRKKVKQWVCMGGNFVGKPAKDDLKLGNVNFQRDAEATYFALRNWPGRVTFVGRDVASVPSALKVGKAFARLPGAHPVRVAYEAYFGGACEDRHVADPAAVLYAVRGLGEYWDVEDKGRLEIRRDMTFEWTYDRDSDQAYLLKKLVDGKPNDRAVEKTIEDLVLTPPRSR